MLKFYEVCIKSLKYFYHRCITDHCAYFVRNHWCLSWHLNGISPCLCHQVCLTLKALVGPAIRTDNKRREKKQNLHCCVCCWRFCGFITVLLLLPPRILRCARWHTNTSHISFLPAGAVCPYSYGNQRTMISGALPPPFRTEPSGYRKRRNLSPLQLG